MSERRCRVSIGITPIIVDLIRRYFVEIVVNAGVLDGEIEAGRRILLREEADYQLEIDLVRLLVEAFHRAYIIFIEEGKCIGA